MGATSNQANACWHGGKPTRNACAPPSMSALSREAEAGQRRWGDATIPWVVIGSIPPPTLPAHSLISKPQGPTRRPRRSPRKPWSERPCASYGKENNHCRPRQASTGSPTQIGLDPPPSHGRSLYSVSLGRACLTSLTPWYRVARQRASEHDEDKQACSKTRAAMLAAAWGRSIGLTFWKLSGMRKYGAVC
jgi:hypothetical protein